MRFAVASLALIGGALAGSNPTIAADMATFNSGTVTGTFSNAPTGATVRVRQQGSVYIQDTDSGFPSASGTWSADVDYASRVDFIAELRNEFDNDTLATSGTFQTNATQYTVNLVVTDTCLDSGYVKYSYTATISPPSRDSDWISVIGKSGSDLDPSNYGEYHTLTVGTTSSSDYLEIEASDDQPHVLAYLPDGDYVVVASTPLTVANTVSNACASPSPSSSTAASPTSTTTTTTTPSSSTVASSSSTVASSSSSSAGSSSSSSAASSSSAGSSSTNSSDDSEGSSSSSSAVASAVFSVGLMAAALLF